MKTTRLPVGTPVGLVVFGLAILALTPAAPRGLRRFELLAVHLYRPLSSAFEKLKLETIGRDPNAHDDDRQRVDAGIARWDATLRTGADQFAPGRDAVVARIVDVDPATRRLLIDAGTGAELTPGDPVLAGRVAVGLVEWSKGSIAIVKTPFTPGARFVGLVAAEAGRPPVRFVTRGVDWGNGFTAAVMNPEREGDLAAGQTVSVPDVSDLLPATVPTLPTGLELGRLSIDPLLAETGREGFCLEPATQFWQLDALVVLPARAGKPADNSDFQADVVKPIACGLLSPWRDGQILTGFNLRDDAAVTSAGVLVGSIESQLLHAAKVRGVFDPEQECHLLVIGDGEPYPIHVRARNRYRDGGRFELITGPRVPTEGDLVVTAGRGAHVLRGLLVGRVVSASEDGFDVVRPALAPDRPTEVLWRKDFPEDPWAEAGKERGN